MGRILSYHLTGNEWRRKGRSSSPDDPVDPPPDPDPEPTPTITSRFPGDPNPKVTGKVLWGIDEYDKNPQALHASEHSKPETVAGVPVSAIRLFYSGNYSVLNPALGAAIQDITEHHSKGRLPWVSVNVGNWPAQADGRNNAVWDAFIHWVETSAQGPVWFCTNHEPETETISKGGSAGTETDWYNVSKAFRARMTNYAASRGGANYVWKKLAFTSVLTAYAYTRGSNAGGIDRYMPNPNEKIFDLMGADYYVGGAQGAIGPAWGANIIATVNWCRNRGFPIGVAEWAVNRNDPDAAVKMTELWNRTFDGTNDIVAWLYYNSSVGNLSETERRWMLDNTSGSGNLLSTYVSYLQNSKTVRYYNLANPSTGVNYPRPPGV